MIFAVTISRCRVEVRNMFKNLSEDGRHNISGRNIKRLRQALPEKTSQRAFAYLMQLRGIDVDKNAVQRIESGQRFVTDIELKVIASILEVTIDELVADEMNATE